MAKKNSEGKARKKESKKPEAKKTEGREKSRKSAKPAKEKKGSRSAPSKAGKPAGISHTVPAAEATRFSEFDIYLFKEGRHHRLYEKLGAHLMEHNGVSGTYFAVWAPNAEQICIMGDFNDWSRAANPMKVRDDDSGIWETFIPGAGNGTLYKYFISSHHRGYKVEKGDPFAFRWEVPPATASMVWDIGNEWKDGAWMQQRQQKAGSARPVSVYEIHFGSWARVPEEKNRALTYREMAQRLPSYIQKLGFTHVEFMPVMEHPFYGSWGYQITGYFAPSSRYGTPQDFMHLVEELHKAGIGVILDWVPSHFPMDEHGLHYFDGTHLYEHEDPRKGYHPDWKSYIFNYGRKEVRAFLISNAIYWLDKFHIDGLRVDAVASLLYLDYSRKEGEWEPNEYGGRENLEAISFLKEFNEAVYKEFPDVHTIAEESTSFPKVSRPTDEDGLGFGMKWMMGWMHDTLEYFSKDPVHRRHHQNEITFSIYYAFTENFMLPLSHDEVVYGKGSLIDKMPGDEWQKFANLRTLYGYMYGHPGAKLLFMGGEFGQFQEWSHERSLDWHLAGEPKHKGLLEMLSQLNAIFSREPALYELLFEEKGFEWIDIHDSGNSVISFLRKGRDSRETILVACNFTPVARENYRIGVPQQGSWKEIFNSDSEMFGGSGSRNQERIRTEELPAHGRMQSIAATLPSLGVIYLKYETE
ncbi:MAG: 1,4-alpha-glucan branching protein GlgB [Bacteroidia bacterium]